MNTKNVILEKLYHIKRDEERVANCYGEGVLTEMKESIKRLGLLNPLTIMLPRPNSTGRWYKVIDGSLRLMALKSLARENAQVVGRTLTMKSFIRCVEMDRMTDEELAKFQTVKIPHGHSVHKAAADNLFPYQREMVNELLAKGRIKIPKDTGKMISISTPKGDDPFRVYFDTETQGLTLKSGDTLKVNYTVTHGDESSNLKNYSARDMEYTKHLADTFKRQTEDRVHRPHIVEINLGELTDSWVMANLRRKRELIEMDFTAFEMAMGVYAHGVLVGTGKSRYFDLGENW